MNKNQQDLYDEWKRIEIATILPVKIGPKNGDYIQVKTIKPDDKPDDFLNLTPVRENVWQELKQFLTQEEKINLGMELGKPFEEILDKGE